MTNKKAPRPAEPKSPDVLVLVDCSPRWVREHTIVAPEHGDPDERARCVVWERLAVVAYDTDGSVELLAVESGTVRRYLNVEPLRGKYIAVAGYYGGDCVADVLHYLRDECGLNVVRVRDLCFWEDVDEAEGPTTRDLWPVRAVRFPDWLETAAEGLDGFLVSAPRNQ